MRTSDEKEERLCSFVQNGKINWSVYVFDICSKVNDISMFKSCFGPFKTLSSSFWSWWFCAPCENVVNKTEDVGVFCPLFLHYFSIVHQ